MTRPSAIRPARREHGRPRGSRPRQAGAARARRTVLPRVARRVARRIAWRIAWRGAPRAALSVAPLAALLAALLAAGGCATYSARVGAVRDELAARDFDAALATVEKNRKGRDLLLYWLEKGLVLHYADRWRESNDAFEQAEQLAADLYTKSVSQGLVSLFTNDTSIDYRADPFELAMVPYYRALNYVYLGERDEAVVEARKASLTLRQWAEQDLGALGQLDPGRQEQKAADDDQLLRNNAFLHYVSGLIYEWGGELNDAFIAYRNAAEAYGPAARRWQLQTPPWLGEDLARTARRLGFRDELAALNQAFPEIMAGAAAADSAARVGRLRGEVVLLLELGSAPLKMQEELNVPILKSDDRRDRDRWARDLWWRTRPGWSAGKAEIDYWLRVAVPKLASNRPLVTGARVSAGVAGGNAVAVPIEDIEGRAFTTFEAEQGAVLLKTLARGLAKYAATKQADKKGKGAGWLANLLGAAFETADTRSWLTLPNRVAMARLRLPAGVYDLQVELTDADGRTVATETIPGVTARSDDTVFLSRRVF